MMEALKRRLVTVPVVFLVAAVVLFLLPVLLVSALVADVIRWTRHRTPFAISRLLLFGTVYLVAQCVGVLVLFGAWLAAGVGPARHGRLQRWTYAIQRAWVASLFGTMRGLYRVRVELSGEEALGQPPGGPVVIMMQHTSLVDTLLPTTFLTARRGLKLRWVLKKELLVDPCLDIAGLRLPNAFVGRDGAETDRALARLRALATGLPRDEGVLIYPEGTRFTRSKRERAIKRIAEGAPDYLARATALRRVLPPRLGGPLALLEAAPEADVVFLGHIGFEGMASLRSVMSGALVRRVIRLRYWRVPRAAVPTEKKALIAWFWERWAELDAWVDAEVAADAASHRKGDTPG